MRRLTIHVLCGVVLVSGCGGQDERPSARVVQPRSRTSESAPAPAIAPAQISTPAPEASPAEVAVAPSPAPTSEPLEEMLPETGPSGETAEAASVSTAPAAAEVLLPRVYGRVSVSGAPPVLPPLVSGPAAAACAVTSIPNEAVVVGPDGGLANCFIFLKSVPSGADVPPVPSEPMIVDQVDCQFIPHASFSRVGQLVIYKNSDAFAHNIRPTPFRNPGFSITTAAGGNLEHTYQLAETRVIQIKCDIHTFMVGYQAIFDHPWCTITDEQGRFELSGLPTGTLEFVAWHEQKGYIERSFSLDIGPESNVERNFVIPASDLAR